MTTAENGREMVSTDLYAVTRVRGLTKDQRRFLGARPLYATDTECCRELRPPIPEQSPRAWRYTSPLFAAAYDTLWDDGIEYGKAEARRLLGLGIQRIEALLTAESPVRTKLGVATRTVRDPETGEEREEAVTAPDWQAQAKGAEMLLRANGLWQPAPAEAPPSDANSAFTLLSEVLKLRRAEIEAARQPQPPAVAVTVIDAGTVQRERLPGASPDSGERPNDPP